MAGMKDYNVISSPLVFSIGVNSVCTDILILDDNALEDPEMFFVTLMANESYIDALGVSSNVTIEDDDGTLLQWFCKWSRYRFCNYIVYSLIASILEGKWPEKELASCLLKISITSIGCQTCVKFFKTYGMLFCSCTHWISAEVIYI